MLCNYYQLAKKKKGTVCALTTKKTQEREATGGISICDICFEAVSYQNMSRHIQEVHNEKKEYKCDLPCDAIFTRPESLNRHKAGKACLNNRKVICCYCGAMFETEKQLISTHLKKSHCPKQYKCGQCGFYFGKPNDYSEHLLTHNGM